MLALRNRIDMIERRQAERRALDEKRRGEETAYLKHQAKHLDLFLKVRGWGGSGEGAPVRLSTLHHLLPSFPSTS